MKTGDLLARVLGLYIQDIANNEYKELLRRDNTAKRKIEARQMDPQANGPRSGYLLPQLHYLSEKLLFSSSPNDVAYRMAALVSHFVLLRWDELQNLCRSDIQIVELLKENPLASDHKCILFGIRKSKTNNTGEQEYVGMARNRELLRCPVSAFAMYMLLRCDVWEQSLPNLSSDDWFNDLVFVMHGRSSSVSKSAIDAGADSLRIESFE